MVRPCENKSSRDELTPDCQDDAEISNEVGNNDENGQEAKGYCGSDGRQSAG